MATCCTRKALRLAWHSAEQGITPSMAVRRAKEATISSLSLRLSGVLKNVLTRICEYRLLPLSLYT